MKTIATLLLFLLASATFAQTVRRVNPDPAVTGTNVAHDAASNGDILIVEPGASVGNLKCIKTLTIYGRGYYLDKNPAYANLANRTSTPTTGNIEIYASNCKIMGINIYSITVKGGANGTTISRNITRDRFYLVGEPGAAINNTVITQNYIGLNPSYTIGTSIALFGNAMGAISNVTISNNLLKSDVAEQDYISNIMVNQNTFEKALFTYGGSYNTIWSNNIFTQPMVINPSAYIVNSSFNNNILFGQSSINSGLGTNNTVLASNVFQLQFIDNTGGSPDNQYRVATTSVIKTSGSTGGEVGMFGGATPYVQSGIPAIPTITKLISTGIGNTTTPITATVSATSNN